MIESFGFNSSAPKSNSGLVYQGTWDANTNNPFLQSSIGNNGYYYIVSVAGHTNLDGYSDWSVGDWAIFNGVTWEKIDNSGISYQGTWDATLNIPYLQSYIGQDGHFYIVSVAGTTDLNGTNSWSIGDWAIFTTGMWLKISNSSGGIAEINSLTSLSQFLQVGNAGSDFNIVSLSATHTFNLPTASSTKRGALSSSDWTTFNNKQNALVIGNISDTSPDGINITGGTGAIIGSGVVIAQQKATSSQNGYLSSADWSTFNSKQNSLTIGDITDIGTDGIVITGGTGAIIGSGVSIAQQKSDATHNGYLSSSDWSTFNSKQSALTIGNLTESTSSVLTIVGGTGAIIGSGTTIQVKQASNSQSGFLSSSDWTTFNSKQNALVIGNITDVSPDGISITGGTGAIIGSGVVISQQVANASQNGYLSSTDWSTFNSKQSPLTIGNLTAVGTDGISVTSGSGAVIGSGTSISQQVASSTQNGYLSSSNWTTFNSKENALTFSSPLLRSVNTISIQVATSLQNGYLSSTDWSTFNNKQNALTIGNLTAVGTDGISVISGTGAIIGSGTSIAQQVANTSQNGYLSSTDWNTFNNKQSALGFTPANSTLTISTTSPLSGGGDLTSNRTLTISQSDTITDGYLSSIDWNTFNNKSRLQYNFSTGTQAISAATLTYLTSSNISSANIKAGTIVTWDISVTKTAAGTAAPIWSVRFGTTSSTSDTAILTFTGAAQTAAADTGKITIQCVFRTVGSGTSAVLVGHYTLVHQLATTGLSTGQGGVFVTSSGFNSTTANAFLGIAVNSGASAVWTVNEVFVKIENIN